MGGKSGKYVLKIVASSGVPGVDYARDRERNITFKTGSLLQSFTCDRGGADFPETGVCYRLNHNGEAWRSVLEMSEAPLTPMPLVMPDLKEQI
jgi:hypothetical protein